jgi:penicillin G amidase
MRRLHALVAPFACIVTLAVLGCSPDKAPPPPGPSTGPVGERLPVDARITIENLSAPVDVVRDKFGRPHIYATSVTDALRAQGYLAAEDRAVELELFRRFSEGRFAEIFAELSKDTIDIDITQRHIGLTRFAKAQYDALPDGEVKQAINAYADGVTQYFRKIRAKEVHLSSSFFLIPVEAFTDYDGVDVLALGRAMQFAVSYDAERDMNREILITGLSSTFPPNDPNPLVSKRAGILVDYLRFAPADPTLTIDGPALHATRPPPPAGSAKAKPVPPALHLHPEVAALTEGYRRAIRSFRGLSARAGAGSNGFVVAGSRSENGHALLASDPHLYLTSPARFWPVSIHVDSADPGVRLDVGGMSFPGVPGIVTGHNAHVGWGSTSSLYDVTDVFHETLTPDGKAVLLDGKPVPLETIDEVIQIKGDKPYTYHVKVVPHHGPIVPVVTPFHNVNDPDPTKSALSVRWSGFDPTNDLQALLGLMRSTDIDDAANAVVGLSAGAQNWMFADTKGRVGWTASANVPVRDKGAFAWDPATFKGTLPCRVLPGDGSAEWRGYRAGALVPSAKDPASGYLITSNNDPSGLTTDNDPSNDVLPDGTPAYLGCFFDVGFRQGRMKALLDERAAVKPEDLAAIQADVRSPLGAELTPRLIEAIDRAEEERANPGKHLDLSAIVVDPAFDPAAVAAVRALLVAWGDKGKYEAASGVDAETNLPLPGSGASAAEVEASRATLFFNTWLVYTFRRTFRDELGRIPGSVGDYLDFLTEANALLHLVEADPKTLATYDPATQESALWDNMDTPAVESKHERMIRGLLDALAQLTRDFGADPTAYRWGAAHTVGLVPVFPFLSALSVPAPSDTTFPKGFPRHGDMFAVDVSYIELFGRLDEPPNFLADTGAVQRLVVEMDPAGPKAWNTLAGGTNEDPGHPHYRDEADLWRRNQTHPVPFSLDDVIAAAESHTVATPTSR